MGDLLSAEREKDTFRDGIASLESLCIRGSVRSTSGGSRGRTSTH